MDSEKPINEIREMKTYFMVFLKSGKNRNQDEVTAAEIQKQHLLYLTKMYNEGHADLIGPLTDGSEVLGIVVYNVSSAEEALRLAEGDPAVVAGRLVAEVHPLYTFKGAVLR
jgi:uncharacterized protein